MEVRVLIISGPLGKYFLEQVAKLAGEVCHTCDGNGAIQRTPCISEQCGDCDGTGKKNERSS
ncbi:MAG TPA: hypothetical protein VEA59_00195 [Patescibacteria group bacterium]|nr:hypothetical protein [Patescibacteria group bacterium]